MRDFNRKDDPAGSKTSKAKYDVSKVSSYILTSAYYNNLPMGLDRLQRLLYYSQARYLAEKDSPLFLEDFRAMPKGPCLEEVDSWFKKRLFIDKDKNDNYHEILDEAGEILDEDKKFLDEVLKTFQDMDTLEISEKTREEEPWKNAFELAEASPIYKEDIKNFFTSDIKNNCRLYGIYDDFEDTDIVNQLFLEPKSDNLQETQMEKDFSNYIDQSLKDSALTKANFHSVNDVLGYVCDFLVYKEKNVTIKELQAILYFIQKLFLKHLYKPCFNEFIFKGKDCVAIGNIPELYRIKAELIDEELMLEKEIDYHNMEREHIAELVRIRILEVKANRYAWEKFTSDELQLMDTVLCKFINLHGFQILNLIQNEEAWIQTKTGELISTRTIYKL